MNIILFSTGIPDPTQGGSGIFNYLIADYLLNEGYGVKAFFRVNETFLKEQCYIKYLEELTRKGLKYEFIFEEKPRRLLFGWPFVLESHHYFLCKRTVEQARKEIQSCDGIISLDLGWALALTDIKKPKICFLGDSIAHRLKFQGGGSFLSPRRYLRFLRRLSLGRTQNHLRHSLRATPGIKTIIASFSPQYVKELQVSSLPCQHFHWFTPFISFPFPRPQVAEKLVVLHVGSLGTTASQNMLHYLMSELFPLLSNLKKNLEIRFVGRTPSQPISRWKNINFVFLGHLDSLEEEFKKAHVFLSVMKYPVGVRSRIVSALSYGIPVIAHISAAQGLPELSHNLDILYGDTPQNIFEIFQQIIAGQIDLEGIGKAARKTWEEHYNPQKNIPALLDALKEV